MSYQVIARRWRPQSFSDLVGQDHIVRTLRNAIESDRIAHAYLFVGPRGTGKTSTARVFARALNAEGGPSVDPPLDSDISQAIMTGSCMDVIEIDGASNNSVEQVRSLREDCQYAPVQCTFKIYIIDEVHMLSQSAFNALLKTLEEPPPHVKFIFATTEAQKLLPTIVSRCQRFEFRPIDVPVIVERLSQIAGAEGIEIEDAALESIARMANGGMRDAQSILDQMISFCGTRISAGDVLEVYGMASLDEVTALCDAVLACDIAQIYLRAEGLSQTGRDLYRVLLDMQMVTRERLLESVRANADSATSTESLMRCLDALREGEKLVQKGLSQQANFEITLLRAAEASRARAIDTLIRRLNTVRPELSAVGAEATTAGPEKKSL